MYLFIFTSLIVVFQYVNSKKILDDSAKRMEKLKERSVVLQDSLNLQNEELSDLTLFDLRYSQEAKDYFYNKKLDSDVMIPYIKNELYKLNEAEGDHPLITFAAFRRRKCR